MQEITRDVLKEYRNIIIELIELKQIQPWIDGLKYKLNGEYQAVKKLDKLKSYLSSNLDRYKDIVKVPQAPEGIEYRSLGIQESLIPVYTSDEEWIKEIEENVRKNKLLKNSFLTTESKKDSIGVHIIQT